MHSLLSALSAPALTALQLEELGHPSWALLALVGFLIVAGALVVLMLFVLCSEPLEGPDNF